MTKNPRNELLDAALSYAARGWAVFPLHSPTKTGCSCGAKECGSPGKHPRTPKGFYDASKDETQIRAWWERWPNANIGLATGKISGVWVLDVDSPEAIDVLEGKLGRALTEGVWAITGRGWHVYFTDDARLKNKTKIEGTSLDARAEGGYVVAPPSRHYLGGCYEWVEGHEGLAPERAPSDLLALLLPKPSTVAAPYRPVVMGGEATGGERYKEVSLNKACQNMATAGPGTRNDTLNKEARGLAGLGIPASVIEAQLGAAARSAGLGAVEVSKTLASGIKSGQNSPRTIPALEPRTRPAGQAKPATIDAVTGEASEQDPIEEMNRRFAVASVGATVAILRESYDPNLGRNVLEYLNERSLNTLYSNRRIQVGEKTVSLASYWLRHPLRRQYERVIFVPGNDDPNYYNRWKGWAVSPKKGNWTKYREHLLENICAGDEHHCEYLLNWMADAVQNPTKRPGVALVLRGKRGVGKGKLWEHFSSLFGQHALQVQQAKQLTGNFNAHLEDCLLLNANEAFWAGDKSAEGALKGLITEPFITIERKGVDAHAAPNRVRIIIDGNEEWIVPSGPEERRYFVLDVGDAHIQDAPYFAAIDKEMASGGREALLFDLIGLDLEGVDLRSVPQTSGLLAQKIISLHPIPRFWFGRLMAGEISEGRIWGEPVPTAELHRAYLNETDQAGERHKKVEMLFSSELGRLVPKLIKRRESVEIDEGSGQFKRRIPSRVQCFTFPPLDECRAAFELFLRSKIAWEV